MADGVILGCFNARTMDSFLAKRTIQNMSGILLRIIYK